MTFDATGATKLGKCAEELKCDTNGDINLRNAWTRRNLAFEGAQVQIWSARVLQVRGERPYNQCEHGLGTQLGEPTAEKRQATFAEFFSGSGSFSQAMRKEGFQVFPVDHNANRFAPKVPTFNIDSSNSDEVKVAVQLFIVLVHCVLEGSSLFDIPFWLKDFHVYSYVFWCPSLPNLFSYVSLRLIFGVGLVSPYFTWGKSQYLAASVVATLQSEST